MKHHKEIMMRDSHLIVNMSRGVTHKGLFSYVLPRVIAVLFLAGLTVYGFFSATTPTAHEFYKRFDNINQVYVWIFCVAGLLVFAVWFLVNKIKGL
jgi:hypothetical protein